VSTPEEPEVAVDYRWILANERTFLAWMRTALGVVAGGVALNQFVTIQHATHLVAALSIVIIAFGAVIALIGAGRWIRTDSAMYSGRPLKRSRFFVALSLIVVVIAAGAAVIVALS